MGNTESSRATTSCPATARPTKAAHPRPPQSVFLISNQGSKTLFTENRAAGERPLLIRPFDEFQENLLRNYSFYCQAVSQARQKASLRSGP